MSFGVVKGDKTKKEKGGSYRRYHWFLFSLQADCVPFPPDWKWGKYIFSLSLSFSFLVYLALLLFLYQSHSSLSTHLLLRVFGSISTITPQIPKRHLQNVCIYIHCYVLALDLIVVKTHAHPPFMKSNTEPRQVFIINKTYSGIKSTCCFGVFLN